MRAMAGSQVEELVVRDPARRPRLAASSASPVSGSAAAPADRHPPRASAPPARDILRYFQTENFLIVSGGIALGMLLAVALNLLLMTALRVAATAAVLPADRRAGAVGAWAACRARPRAARGGGAAGGGDEVGVMRWVSSNISSGSALLDAGVHGMFGYYLDLALRSLKRNKVLTALMVLAIGLGIGASMTTLTVMHCCRAIRCRSERQLFYPQVDPMPLDAQERAGSRADRQLTWLDAMDLWRRSAPIAQAMMVGGNHGGAAGGAARSRCAMHTLVRPRRISSRCSACRSARRSLDRGTTTPAGRGGGARPTLSDKLFGGADSMGRTLRLGEPTCASSACIEPWRPSPHVLRPVAAGSFRPGRWRVLPAGEHGAMA